MPKKKRRPNFSQSSWIDKLSIVINGVARELKAYISRIFNLAIDIYITAAPRITAPWRKLRSFNDWLKQRETS